MTWPPPAKRQGAGLALLPGSLVSAIGFRPITPAWASSPLPKRYRNIRQPADRQPTASAATMEPVVRRDPLALCGRHQTATA